jgi:hypothetical protein
MSMVETERAVGKTDELSARVARLASRSPTITQLRLNPFQVLRVPVSAEVDEVIWRSEELLTRMRAGIPDAAPDLIPWLARPDEHEVRQAVQRIEEPLRRLADELFWFDLTLDPHAELLKSALAGLSPSDVSAYLATGDALTTQEAPVAVDPEADPDAPPVEKPAGSATDAAVELNQANFRLLLGALALVDALPEAKRSGEEAPAVLSWKRQGELEVIDDFHALDLSDGRFQARLEEAGKVWSDALKRWTMVLRSPGLMALVEERASRLGDDSVGPDDAETVISAAESRLTELVAGEIKGQLLAGRPDRVKLLVEAAASSGLESRRWIFALRSLRPLFRSEAAELEPLLGDADDTRLDDIGHYLHRLKALRDRWNQIDPTGLLGLTEAADEAVVVAFNRLSALENYGTIARLKALLDDASNLASADSIKHRISSAVARLDGLARYACHFCKTNEMDLDRSVVLKGKKESHRTYGFNSTTIHYILTRDIVQRCPRCAQLHEYLNSVALWTRICLGTVGVLLAIRIVVEHNDAIIGVAIFGSLALSILLWIVGSLARFIAKLVVTPKGENRYGDIHGAAQYKRLRSEKFGIEVDYASDSFQKAMKESGG